MSKVLKLAKDLSLPLDAVTQTFLIVGKRGSGKSNTAARFVEQLHRARLPFVVLDPVDTWWGLKADRDGGRGLDVYVFGGRKQDLPLEAGGGALIAEVLCEHRMSMVLSVKHLSGRERSKFMVAFAQTLFQKWGGGPLHVVLEEAHELAPQMGGRATNDTDGEAAMLGAFKRLWKLGRAAGIGGTAVTQRPASLSKDITTQSEILIAHRTIGPQDVAAIGQWVKYHGEREDILAELPSLPTGEAFIWAPEFPEGKPLGLQRTTVLLRETFDSASTPKVGESRVEPKELAPVDLDRLRTKMAATIEKAKQDDPKELKKQLAAVRQELAKSQQVAAKPVQASAPGKIEPVLTDSDRTALAELASLLRETARTFSGGDAGSAAVFQQRAEDAVVEAFTRLRRELSDLVVARHERFAERLEKAGFQRILDKLDRVTVTPKHPTERPGQARSLPAAQPGRASVATRPAPRQAVDGSGDEGIGNTGLRRMMIALAQRNGLSARQLALRSGMSASGGSFRTYLSKGRVNGWINGDSHRIELTDAGVTALGAYDPLPEGVDLQAYWLNELGNTGAAALLRALCEAYPRGLSQDDLAEKTGMSRAGGSFRTYLSRLRTLELIQGKGELRASEELFG